jgi:hypothetical protein
VICLTASGSLRAICPRYQDENVRLRESYRRGAAGNLNAVARPVVNERNESTASAGNGRTNRGSTAHIGVGDVVIKIFGPDQNV